MAFTNKLVNPTPFDVKIGWEPGRPIRVKADGFKELSHEQMPDFRVDAPGYAEFRGQLDFHGVFLLDADLGYDEQALAALKRSFQLKSEEYKNRMQNMRSLRAAAGMKPDQETMDELERTSGLVGVRKQVDELKERISYLEGVVSTQAPSEKKKLDLSITCLATTPPREFASPSALKMFLASNPDLAAKHNTLVEAMLEGQEEVANVTAE